MKPHKYGVAPKAERTIGGVTYASKAESLRAAQLKFLADSCGWIVTPQPKFTLGCPENVYIADFQVRDSEGQWFHDCDPAILVSVWVEDVKGIKTAKFRHDVKLWRKYGPVPLVILKRKGRGWIRHVVLPEDLEREI
jgi:hypothetical protein